MPTPHSRVLLLAAAGLVALGLPRGTEPVPSETLAPAPSERLEPLLEGPAVPNEVFFLQRLDENGEFRVERQREALRQKQRLRARTHFRATRAGEPAPAWQLVGPTNVGGRVTDLAGDPTDPTRFFVGAANGGVWRTLDGGATFEPVFDGYGSPSIGALALDPNDPDVLWVGTGESNAGGGSIVAPGDGVWKSTDGGDTFQQMGLADTVSIGRIVIDPTSSSRVFVAATGNLYGSDQSRGIYRTEDGGASWERVLFVSERSGGVDLAIDPVDPSRVFATMWERFRAPDVRDYGGEDSGLWRSEDSGDSWTLLTHGLTGSQANGLPGSQALLGRIAVAVAPSDPDVVYAMLTLADGSFEGIYRSLDGGDSWTKQSASGLTSNFCGTSCYWFGRLWVDPADASDLWADGIGLYRSRNGGTSFSSVTGLHVDHHAQWFFGGAEPFILKGNDGGLYRSTDDGANWEHFDNLPITQYYAMGVSALRPEAIFGGTQDNGTNRTLTGSPDDWTQRLGGDGFSVVFNPEDPDVVYGEMQWGKLFRSLNGGGSFTAINPTNMLRAAWHAPLALDPVDPRVLYFGGARLYRTEDAEQFTPSWSVLSDDLSDGVTGTGGAVFGTLSRIAVAPSNRDTLYLGTDDGNLWRSLDRGATYESISSGLPDRWVSAIEVDASDDAHLWVAFSGYRSNDGQAHVFESVDFGDSWNDISGDLPDAPVNELVAHPGDPSRLYLASDVGAFATTDGGASWGELASGLPETVVTDLVLLDRYGDQTLFAATYGRSIWSLELAESSLVVYADDFDPEGYDGSDGTRQWIGDWQEIGDDGVMDSGSVYLWDQADACARGSCVRIEAAEGDEGIERSMDLSEVETATLRFDYTIFGGTTGADLVLDDGTGPVTVQTLTVPAAGEGSSVELLIEDWVSLTSTVTLRFAATSANGNRTYPDSIEVVGVPAPAPPPPPEPEVIFEDDFETGTTDAWSSS